MSNLLVDERDQKFVLHEMLKVEDLFQTSLYGHLSKDLVDASLDAALKLAVKESYPVMAEADREGCRVENGNVLSPKCFHRLKSHYDQSKFASAYLPREDGGLGLPMSVWTPLFECFVHNYTFLWVWAGPFSGMNLISQFGSEEQKAKYLPNLVSGKWGSALACTEEQAGSDIALQTTAAVKQPDGSYRIKGNKPTVTTGDSDMFENMVVCTCARIEGDSPGADGLSLFLVPKYLVNGDGSRGARNDYSIVGIEPTLGKKGGPTVSINFGENGGCYGELLGERGRGLDMVVSLFQGKPFYGIIATGIASAAYLHSLDHATKRIQGVHISDIQNPGAQRVPIISHPYVRWLLLRMKAQVEGMRALVYYSCLCHDKANSHPDPAEREKWSGLLTVLFPMFRRYPGEKGFDVTQDAIQVHGRYGFFTDYPVQQFLRDIIPLSWWEHDGGAFTLLYVAQMMGARDGKDFANLLEEMKRTVTECGNIDSVRDLAKDVGSRVNLLSDMGRYFADCFKEGKALIPIANGMQLINFMGDICVGWMLLWQAGIATKRLQEIFQENGVDPQDAAKRFDFLGKNKEAAFYHGKVHSARFFIKNVLPQVDGMAAAIKNEDLSLMAVHNAGF